MPDILSQLGFSSSLRREAYNPTNTENVDIMSNWTPDNVQQIIPDNSIGWNKLQAGVYDAIVDPNGGGTHLTLDNAVKSGATNIFLRAGTYTRYATITISNANTKITGENWLSTIIAGNFAFDVNAAGFQINNVKITGAPTGAYLFDLDTTDADDCEINHCYISYTGASFGIVENQGNNLRFENNYISINYTETSSTPTYYVIEQKTDNGVFSNNTITSTTNFVSTFTGNNNYVFNNNISFTGDTASQYCLKISGTNNLVDSNTIDCTATTVVIYGLYIAGGRNVINGNYLADNGIILASGGSANNITNNYIIGSSISNSFGIRVISGATYNCINANFIQAHHFGITIGASFNHCENNFLYLTASTGISTTANDTSIIGNFLDTPIGHAITLGSNLNNANDNFVYNGAAYGISVTGDYNNIDGNVFYAGTYGIVLAYGADFNNVNDNYSYNPTYSSYFSSGDVCSMSGNYSYNAGGDGLVIGGYYNKTNDNYIYNPADEGIKLSGASAYGNLISGNVVYSSASTGIIGDNDAQIYNSIIGNYIAGCYSGIALVGGKSKVSGNYIYGDTTSSGIAINDPFCDVNDNYIYNTKGYGIYIDDTDCNVNHNYIYTSELDGIYLADGALRTNVVGNMIYISGAAGVYTHASAVNCQINSNYIYDAVGTGIDANATGVSIVGNTCHTCGADGIDVAGDDALISNNYCESNTGCGIELSKGTAPDECCLTGNVCRTNTTYGIYSANNPTSTVAVGNMTKGNTTANFSITAGANSEVAHNVNT